MRGVRARTGAVVALARRRPVATAALVVLVLALGILYARSSTQPTPLPRAAAIHDVMSDPRAISRLRLLRGATITVSAIDNQLTRVEFDRGQMVVAQFAVARSGRVTQALYFVALGVPYGNYIAYLPPMLLGLAALFTLMTGVAPLMRLRNLDVLAALSLIAPVVLLQRHLVGLSVLAAVPGLLYLMARCAWLALGHPRDPTPSRPLFDLVTHGWTGAQRVRMLRFLLMAVALIVAMLTVSSADPVDVLLAVMEGATRLIHGVLPYGHMPGDIIHGDTYPIGSYALYAPLALISPVSSTWDSVDLGLTLTALAALVCAEGVSRHVAAVAERIPGRCAEAEEAGLRAALAWLAFPPLLIVVSTGTTDVAMAAMVLGAVLLWRRPAAAALVLALGGWFKLAPAALLPLWLAPLRGRRLLVALVPVIVVSAAMLALLAAVGGTGGVRQMLHAMSYQFSRGSPQSVWAVLGLRWLQPAAQAAVIALIAAGAVALARDVELAADTSRVAALSAAVLVGLQLSADYWAFLYLVWVIPLFVISLLACPLPAAAAEQALIERRSPALAASTP